MKCHERKDELAATGMEECEEKFAQARENEKRVCEERLADEGRETKGHAQKDAFAAETMEEYQEEFTQERAGEKDQLGVHLDRREQYYCNDAEMKTLLDEFRRGLNEHFARGIDRATKHRLM